MGFGIEYQEPGGTQWFALSNRLSFAGADAPDLQKVVCGSTNFSWRGFYVQNNNAVVLTGTTAVTLFEAAFDQYWASDHAAARPRSVPMLPNRSTPNRLEVPAYACTTSSS